METANVAVAPAPQARRSTQAIVLCVLGILVSLALDLGTKHWAQMNLSSERVGEAPPLCAPSEGGYILYQRVPTAPYVLWQNYFDFEYAENCGAAFSSLRTAPAYVRLGVFGIAAVAASIFLMIAFIRGSGSRYFAWAVPFVVSGALGNLIDRLRLGYVVDFIHVHNGDNWNYPTFNVADIVIAIGVGLLLIDAMRGSSTQTKASDTNDSKAVTEKPAALSEKDAVPDQTTAL